MSNTHGVPKLGGNVLLACCSFKNSTKSFYKYISKNVPKRIPVL